MITQHTLGDEIAVVGIGVHSGAPATATLTPAPVGTGLVFSLAGRACHIPAHADAVSATELCTVLGDGEATISTVEHLLAALRGMAVDNALIEVDGPEMPILDGSAQEFVAAIDEVGVVAQSEPRRVIKVLKTVRVEQGDAFGELSPHAGGLRLEVEIGFPHPLIGDQRLALDLSPETFRRELMAARTFGFLKDVEKLARLGLGRGASLQNTVVLDDERVLNPAGLRAPDEFVRHKMLDAVGDLALAGLPLAGCYRSHHGGHRLNVSMVRALLADRSAWTVVEMPARRRIAHGDYAGTVQAAFAPVVD